MTATPAVPSPGHDSPLMGQGFHWQDLRVGQTLRTLRRTVTEADLVGFIGVTGMLEAMFLEADSAHGAIGGRPVPAALTYCLIEGFILQSMIQGTGLAMLEMQQDIKAPVRVGDTVRGVVQVTEIRPTSRSNRAVVGSLISVYNQRDELVMTYACKRLLAGRPDAANEGSP
ncbi:MAG: MaoC family dehydratase [Burkholderiaceae bacterium]